MHLPTEIGSKMNLIYIIGTVTQPQSKNKRLNHDNLHVNIAYITEVATDMTAVAGAGFMGLLQAILGRNSCVRQNTCLKLPEARARQVFSLRSVYFVALPGGAFLLWWMETQTMAGTHSSHVYTMEEVLGMLDTVDEPICDGSDDDFDTDYLNYDDQDMTR